MRDEYSFKSEADFIAWIRRRTPRRVAGLTLGIGDDAALITVSPGQEIILTTDMSIECVHFTPTLHPPTAVGHRALARSLSDIAAMGGTPRYALISLAVSHRTKRAWLKGFFGGLFALARGSFPWLSSAVTPLSSRAPLRRTWLWQALSHVAWRYAARAPNPETAFSSVGALACQRWGCVCSCPEAAFGILCRGQPCALIFSPNLNVP